MVAGPSGVGKGTVLAELLRIRPNIWLSVSVTTRTPRTGEEDGVDYSFVTRDEFERIRRTGGFLESFDVYGDLKGTPRGPVEQHLAAGEDVVLEIDVQGALAVREQMPEALLVFLAPPSRAEQIRRITGRGTDDPDAVARRVAAAETEEARAVEFDEIVVNDRVERVAARLAAILAERRAGETPGS